MLVLAIIVAAIAVAIALDASAKKVAAPIRAQTAHLEKIAVQLEELRNAGRGVHGLMQDRARIEADERSDIAREKRRKEAKELRDGIAAGTVRVFKD